MGSFIGHIVPGFFMLLFGLRTAYCVLCQYYTSLGRGVWRGNQRRGLDKKTKQKHKKRNQMMMNSNSTATGKGKTREDEDDDEEEEDCDYGDDYVVDYNHDDGSSDSRKIGFVAQTFYGYGNQRTLDAYLCLILASVGIVGEWITGFKDGKFVHYHNVQHILMYTGFAAAAFTRIKSSSSCNCDDPRDDHDVRRNNNNKKMMMMTKRKNYSILPLGTDYATLVLALMIEAILFIFHLHGRSMLDVHVHQLLVIAIVMGMIACITEWNDRSNPLLALFRSYALNVQGSWLCQIGFILYNPLPSAIPWSSADHNEMMIVTSIFVAHLIGNLLLMYIIANLIFKSCINDKNNNPNPKSFSNLPYQSIVEEVIEFDINSSTSSSPSPSPSKP